jgi:hypothetical protein
MEVTGGIAEVRGHIAEVKLGLSAVLGGRIEVGGAGASLL